MELARSLFVKCVVLGHNNEYSSDFRQCPPRSKNSTSGTHSRVPPLAQCLSALAPQREIHRKNHLKTCNRVGPQWTYSRNYCHRGNISRVVKTVSLRNVECQIHLFWHFVRVLTDWGQNQSARSIFPSRRTTPVREFRCGS